MLQCNKCNMYNETVKLRPDDSIQCDPCWEGVLFRVVKTWKHGGAYCNLPKKWAGKTVKVNKLDK